MPLYVYQCKQHGQFEAFHPAKGRMRIRCPICKKTAKKLCPQPGALAILNSKMDYEDRTFDRILGEQGTKERKENVKKVKTGEIAIYEASKWKR